MVERLPPWLRKRYRPSETVHGLKVLLRQKRLHTVCEEASCPNIFECFAKPTATFMLLGDICTRSCGFCGVTKGRPLAVDPLEPQRIAAAVRELQLRHVVLTSVNRDDMPDGGAAHFAAVVEEVHRTSSASTVEVLTPDFMGDEDAVRTVVASRPEIYNHNTETVPRLYRRVRPKAVYERSLHLLRLVKDTDPSIYTKSGVMVGLGEAFDEVVQVMRDLRAVGCDILTIGQYLRPSKDRLPVVEYVHPDIFCEYERAGNELGFTFVAAGPFVRSSYNAEGLFDQIRARRGPAYPPAEPVRVWPSAGESVQWTQFR